MFLNCVVILYFFSVVFSFNLDTVNYVKHRGQSSSMFGFTVATHRERGNSWILVGAPEAQNLQPDVHRSGAVYRCRIDTDDSCQEIPFDSKGHNIDNLGSFIDSKSLQWFGATLKSAGENGPIVACAPRYVYFGSRRDRDRRDPVGTCYVANGDFTSFSEYSPCRTTLSGYHRQGSCQAGFSAAISKDGRRLFVGAPGSWYWQGQMYSIDALASFPFTPGKFGGAFGSGQVIQQSLETRPSVISTKEGSERDDDSYKGYSMVVGDFTGDGEQGIAVGMPRGLSLSGKIVLYTWNLTNHQNITGTQLGSYFGYSLASGDIDGDGTDDLIIGAPLHTEPNNEGKYEVGRVYVVYQGKISSERFRRLIALDGFNSKSRFGLSVASLGDINLDGFGDFAVGAPYDGPRERGAVYVYHGSKEVVGEKFSQVIFAEEVGIPGMPMNTFGFSISGGMDLDHNDYPDMAVGAYLSDSAYFFRARPVVKIDVNVRYLIASKQIILDEKNCTLTNRQSVPCTSIDVCLKFSGVGVPQTIDLEVQYLLDAKKTKDPRMYFLSNENRNILNETITLQKDTRNICRQKIVYIKNDIRDKLTPLEVEIRYSMKESRSYQQSERRNPRSPLTPILDMNSPLVKKDSISVHKNCGPDNVCIPNLRLIAKSNVQKYLLGSNEKLEFDIVVQNEGEDSFESTFDIRMPPGVQFNKIVQYNKTEVRVLCSEMENNTIRCDIGNPLPAEKIARFNIKMTPHHEEGMMPSYDFTMIVNSTNPELSDTIGDNKVDMSIHIWVDSKLELGGASKPSEVYYNKSLYTSDKIQRESDIGPQIIHLYTIRNNGPSSINEAEMLFLWPYSTLGGEDLLYLLEQPHTLGNIRCEQADANYRGYELDFRKKSIWETLNVDVSKGEFASGLILEEGKETYGTLGGDKFDLKTVKHDFEQSGDGSLIHQQRRKQQFSGGETSSGTIVHVGQDTGSGSKVLVESHSSNWNKTHSGPSISNTGSNSNFHYYEKPYTGRGTAVIGGDSTHYSGEASASTGGSTHSSSSVSTGGSTHSSSSVSTGGTRHSSSSVSSGGASHSGSTGGTSYSVGGSKNFSDQFRPSTSNYGSGSIERTSSSSGKDGTPEHGSVSAGRNEQRTDISSGQSQYSSGRTSQAGVSTHREHEIVRGTVKPNIIYTASGQNTLYDERRNENRQGESYDSATSYEDRHRSEHAGGQNGSKHFNWDDSVNSRTETGGSLGRHESHGSRHYSQTGANDYDSTRNQNEHVYPDSYDLPYSSEEYGSVPSKRIRPETSREHSYDTSGHNRSLSSSGRDRTTYGQYNKTNINVEHGLGAAAVGHGFKTISLDLGQLGGNSITSSTSHFDEERTRVDGNDEIRRAQEYEERRRIDEERTRIEDERRRTHEYEERRRIDEERRRAEEERRRAYYEREERNRANSGQGSRSQSGGGSSWESHSESHYSSSGKGLPPNFDEVERDNVPTDKPNLQNRFYGRRKRQAFNSDEDDIHNIMECKSTKCLLIKCSVGPLLKDQDAIIALRSRVNVRALSNITTSQPITFSSMALARISKLPYIGKPLDRPTHSFEIFTNIPASNPDITPEGFPLWAAILSTVAGTIILLLLIYLLYKCGFFKRNRPSNAPERQPLNRNGYYQNGDAAL